MGPDEEQTTEKRNDGLPDDPVARFLVRAGASVGVSAVIVLVVALVVKFVLVLFD